MHWHSVHCCMESVCTLVLKVQVTCTLGKQKVLLTPLSFTGQVQTGSWQVKLTWRRDPTHYKMLFCIWYMCFSSGSSCGTCSKCLYMGSTSIGFNFIVQWVTEPTSLHAPTRLVSLFIKCYLTASIRINIPFVAVLLSYAARVQRHKVIDGDNLKWYGARLS